MTGWRLFLYRLLRGLIVQACSLPWRVKVLHKERVPKSGAYILAPTHRSMLDIPWATGVTTRRVRQMGKAPLFRIPVLGSIFRFLGGFPVERDGSDRGPLRDALKFLEAGDPIFVYPEGTRQNGHEITNLQPGAAYLAIKAQVPIVPIAIVGSEEPFRSPRRFRAIPKLKTRGIVLVGEPMQPPVRTGSVVKRELVNEFTDQLRVVLQRLYDEARGA